MKSRQIKIIFFMSLLELISLMGCVLFSYMQGGKAPVFAGLIGLLVMICSFIGSVYGGFAIKEWKENRNYMGIVGTWLHLLIFLLLLFLYIIGMIEQ